MIPGNPVVGGTVLRIPAIQSPNFVAGVSGWFIGADGAAEFDDITLRGAYVGTDYTFDPDGAFWFDPVTGSLIISDAAADGTAFGSPYLAGTTVYYTSPGGAVYALNMSAGAGYVPLSWASWDGSAWVGSAFIASILATGLNIDSSASGDLTLDAGGHKINLESDIPAATIGIISSAGGTPASPTLITTDTWQTASPGTGWSAGNGVGGIFWRLTADNMVDLIWDIETSTSSNANAIVTLGSAYRPATAVQLGSGHASGAPAAYTPGFAPSVKIAVNGAVTAQGIPSLSGTIELFGSARFPLGAL